MARLRTAHLAYQAASSLGQKKSSPTWATPAGPHVVSHPSSSNGHARNPAEQNWHRRPRPNPSTFSPLSFSLRRARVSKPSPPRRSTDELLNVRRENGSVAPSGAPRRRACPPLGGRATVKWPHGGVFLRSCTPIATSAGDVEVSNTARSHKRCTDEISSPTMHRRAVVRVLPVWRVDPRPAVFREGNPGKNLIATHSSSVCYPNHLLLLSSTPI
jgi:hypothetical protein